MKRRTVAVETLEAPQKYAHHQIQLALQIAYRINRGRFVLLEPPAPR